MNTKFKLEVEMNEADYQAIVDIAEDGDQAYLMP